MLKVLDELKESLVWKDLGLAAGSPSDGCWWSGLVLHIDLHWVR